MTEITKFESAPIANISDFVQIKDEQVYTTSRIVAEKFGKRINTDSEDEFSMS